MTIDLAVVNATETFDRIVHPLADRGIDATHLPVTGRTIPLGDPPWSPETVDVGFVYPGRLMEGAVADAFLAVPWVNGREAVLTSRNKAGVLARLERAGLPVPETVYVSSPVDESALRALFERFDPPVVLKPNSTTRGVGVARADDLDSFLGICDYLGLVHSYPATADRSFLVQEYIAEATDIRAMVLEGRVVGAVERRLSAPAREAGQWKHNVHLGAMATATDLSEALRNLAEQAGDVCEIPFCGVDLLVTDDRTVVSETNARPTIDAAEKYDDDFYDRLAATIRARADPGA